MTTASDEYRPRCLDCEGGYDSNKGVFLCPLHAHTEDLRSAAGIAAIFIRNRPYGSAAQDATLAVLEHALRISDIEEATA